MLYEVTSPGGRVAHVEADNSTQAKRKACALWGYKPSDPWVGVANMRARKI